MTTTFSDEPMSRIEQTHNVELKELRDDLGHAESAQHHAVALLNSVMNTSSDGLITADSNGIVTRFNPVCQRIFGYTGREVLSKPVGMLLVERDARSLDEYFKNAMFRDPRSTLVSVRKVAGITKGGDKLDVELSFGNVIAPDGSVSYVISLRDVSRKSRLKRKLDDVRVELEEAQAQVEQLTGRLASSVMDAKEVSYVVSHDLRAPVVNLVGFGAEVGRLLTKLRANESVQTALEESEEARDLLDEQMPEVLSFMHMSGEKAQRRFDDIVRWSRLGAGDFKPTSVSLPALVNEIIHAHIAPEHFESFAHVLGSAPVLKINRTALTAIIKILLKNSLESAHPKRRLRVQIGAEWDDHFITLMIQDNGVGIAAADTDRIFKMFQTAGKSPAPGHGCGLTNCKTLVSRMGGKIWCESSEDDGALFRVRLPIEQDYELPELAAKPVSDERRL